MCGVMWLAAVSCAPAVAGDAAEPSLDVILTKNRQAVATVASLRANYSEYEPYAAGRLLSAGVLHIDPTTVVIEAGPTSVGGSSRAVWRAGIGMTFRRKSDPATQWQLLIRPQNIEESPAHPFSQLLLSLPGDGGRAYTPVAKYCEDNRSKVFGKKVVMDSGHEYSVLSLRKTVPAGGDKTESIVEELWFSHENGHLLDRITMRTEDSTWRRVRRVVRYATPVPGVSVSAEVSDERSGEPGQPPGVLSGGVRYKLDNVRVSLPIPTALTDTTVPPLADVADEVAGKRYKTGPDGKPVGEPQPLARHPSLPNPAAPSRQAADAPPPTTGEPRRWSDRVLPVGAACLVTAALLWLVAARRRGRSN